MAGEKISQAEMIEMFGEAMPMEAVNLLWDSPGEMTVGEMRDKLREIAANRPATPPFTLSGPDNDGLIWLHMKLEDGTQTNLNLGKQEDVAEILSQKLGEWDYGERD